MPRKRKKKRSSVEQRKKKDAFWKQLKEQVAAGTAPHWMVQKLAAVTFYKDKKKDKKHRKSLDTRSERQIWYQDVYLQSDLWKSIRTKVLKRDEYHCVVCGQDTGIVHHISYAQDVMDGKNLDELISLCKQCHHDVHHDGTMFVSTEESKKRLAQMVKNPSLRP